MSSRKIRRVLILLAVFAFLVGVMGLGRPRRFRLALGSVQVLEGPRGLVAFIGVRRPSKVALVDDPFMGPTPYIFKQEIAPDGSVRTARYRPRPGLAYQTGVNPNVTDVVAVGDDFFLVDKDRDDALVMLRFGTGDDLEPATEAERAAYLASGPSPEWRPLEGGIEFKSARHAIQIGEDWTGDGFRSVAESTSPERPWKVVLVEVDPRPWYAYARPYDDLTPR